MSQKISVIAVIAVIGLFVKSRSPKRGGRGAITEKNAGVYLDHLGGYMDLSPLETSEKSEARWWQAR
jgi:hypothetical protein